jgi:hypothetical protein
MMAVLFSPTDSIARQQAINTKVASRGIAHPKIWVIQRLGSFEKAGSVDSPSCEIMPRRIHCAAPATLSAKA